MSHAVRKMQYALKVTRLVNAPEMSAGVMMANIIWYAMNTIAGIVSVGADGVERLMPRRQTLLRLPMIPCQSPLKHSEYPYRYQMTVVQPIETKL